MPAEEFLTTSLEAEAESHTDSSCSSSSLSNNSKLSKKKEKDKLTLSKYLYFKKTAKEETLKQGNTRWHEKLKLKQAEVQAINNLADAIRFSVQGKEAEKKVVRNAEEKENQE